MGLDADFSAENIFALADVRAFDLGSEHSSGGHLPSLVADLSAAKPEKRIMKKPALLFVVVSLATAPTLFAQSRFAQLIEIRVAPVHQQAFENFAMKVKEAADKIESPVSWATFYAAVGKPGATYRISIGFDTWGERDQWSEVSDMLTRAFGEKEAARILRDGRLGIVSETSRIWERLEDGTSNPRPGNQPANFYEVTIRHVRREMLPEYRELQRRWKAAYEASSDKPSVTRWILRYGDGAGATFRRAAPFDTWAARDGWRIPEILREQFGEEGYQLSNRTRDRALEGAETFVSAYRPDLSRTASSPTSD
jgi:hypothetical protein